MFWSLYWCFFNSKLPFYVELRHVKVSKISSFFTMKFIIVKMKFIVFHREIHRFSSWNFHSVNEKGIVEWKRHWKTTISNTVIWNSPKLYRMIENSQTSFEWMRDVCPFHWWNWHNEPNFIDEKGVLVMNKRHLFSMNFFQRKIQITAYMQIKTCSCKDGGLEIVGESEMQT